MISRKRSIRPQGETESARRKRNIHDRIKGLVAFTADDFYDKKLLPEWLREAQASRDVICFLKAEIRLLEQRRLELAANIKK